MDLTEFRSKGGKARAKVLPAKRRKEIALKAGLANKARIESKRISSSK